MTDRSANHRYRCALFVIIAIQMIACRTRTEWSVMEQRFAELRRMERVSQHLPERQRIAVIGVGYDRMVAPAHQHEDLAGIQDGDLGILFQAAQLATFYTRDQERVRSMASFLNELQERGLASKTDYVHMYEAFVGARMLAEARALAGQHPMPEMEALPDLREAAGVVPGQPTEWVVNPSKREVLRRSVDLRRPAQVVIVSHPLCHFSRAAARDIQGDLVLSKALEGHATWLAPQDNRVNFDVVQKWNRQHPEQQITLTYHREEWPMIESWATPTFYFLKDGEVVAKVEGWPKAGRRPELVAALRQIGLLQ